MQSPPLLLPLLPRAPTKEPLLGSFLNRAIVRVKKMKWEFPNVTGALVQLYTFARRRKSNRPYLHASVKIAHKRDFRSFVRAEIFWGMQIELAWWWKPEPAAGALYNWVLPFLSPPVVKSAKNPPFFLSPSKVTSRSKGKRGKEEKCPRGLRREGTRGRGG